MTLSVWFTGVRGKILILCCFATVASIISSLIGLSAVRNLESAVHTAYDERAPKMIMLGNLDTEVNALMRWDWALYFETDSATRKELLTTVQETADGLEEISKKYTGLKKSAKTQAVMDEKITPHLTKAFSSEKEFLREAAAATDSCARCKTILTKEILPEMVIVSKGIKELDKMTLENNQAAKLEAFTSAAQSLSLLVWAGIILTCFVMASGFFIARRMAAALSNSANQVAGNSANVTASISKLSQMSQELSSASVQQSASLQQTSAAIEQIAAMVRKATESAADSAILSERSQSRAEHGKNVVGEMVNSMQEINLNNDLIVTEIKASNAKISDIVHLIQDIGAKTKVINDIVFQTKLLSFNASVEAARAGESGKGFAVVAEEVGNLAQMSGNASKEITAMLEDSVKKVEGIVQETNQRVQQIVETAKITVEKGKNVAQQCETVLNEIVQTAGDVSKQVKSISVASDEQSRGVNEISSAIRELDRISHTNTSAATESANSAADLTEQAEQLNHVSEELMVIIDGSSAVNGHADQHATVTSIEQEQIKRKLSRAS